jgi:glycosyltransferase involved in cell wall biosynthesis
MKKISVIVPVHNEALGIDWFYDELKRETSKLKLAFEYIFVDDGSSDESLQHLQAIAKKDKAVRVITFSRNFGKEAAVSAGITHCTGDCAITLDADGQHPPRMISTFVNKWEDGAQVVIGLRTQNQGEGFVKKYGSKLYYKIMGSILKEDVVSGSTDFRLIDREVIEQFAKLTEKNRMTRYLIDWLGYNKVYLPFQADERHAGKASYSFPKLVQLAVNGVTSQSFLPLRLSGYIGVILMSLALLGLLTAVVDMFILGDPLSLGATATAYLVLTILFFVGLILWCQGLLALYIENIHHETRNRPLYIINEAQSTFRSSQKR